MTPEQHSQFDADLRAALLAGVPLEIGDQRIPGLLLTEARANELQEVVRNALAAESSDTLNGPLESVAANLGLPVRYLAALKTFALTGTMVPVFEGLSSRPLAMQDVGRSIYRALLYVGLLLLVAFLGLLLFSFEVAPVIANMRADNPLDEWSVEPVQFSSDRWLPIVLQILGVTIVAALVWALLRGGRTVVWWLGGARQTQLRGKATAFKTMCLLVSSGISKAEAASISSHLAGLSPNDVSEIHAASNQPGGQQVLQTLSYYLFNASKRHLVSVQTGVPIFVVSLTGGLITLLYCVLIFWPIASLLKDLGT